MKARGWIPGAVVLLVALAAGAEALTFTVSFPTDPIGPRAFPLLGVGLLLLGAGALFGSATGTAEFPVWPDRESVRHIFLAFLSFVLYALLLAPVGFVLATTLEFAFLGVLFGGKPIRSAVAGVSLAIVLFGLFVYGLGLPLPPGSWLG